MTERKLTAKQQRFVEEYLIDLNATQAAIRAGYSQDTAYSQGQRLLKNVEVSQVVKKSLQERSKRTQIDADWVLKEAAEIATMHKADNPSAAVSALNIVAKHQAVDAFAADKQRQVNKNGDDVQPFVVQVHGIPAKDTE